MKNTCLVIVILLVTTFCFNNAQTTEDDAGDNLPGSVNTPKVCEPGTTKMQECNRCRCSINGRAWMCTRKACPSFMRTIAPNQPGFICTPNKVFKLECNTCTCNENGTSASCTEMACGERTLVLSERKFEVTTTTTEVPETDGKCVPGTRWKNDCNWCFCTETGFGACTLKGCLGKINLPNIQTTINHVRRKRQAINQYHPTGGETIYTLEDLFDPNFSCIPSESFKVECNTCWCAADGKRARFCTRIACSPRITTNLEASTKTYRKDIDSKFAN